MAQAYGAGSCGVGFLCDIRGARSHRVVSLGVTAVRNLTHRGAVGADGKTGDGAGVLIEIPRKLLLAELSAGGIAPSRPEDLAVGMLFLSSDVQRFIEGIVGEFGLKVLAWREVPTRDAALGKAALEVRPRIFQLLLDTGDVGEAEREVRLYFTRRAIEKRHPEVHVASFSSRTVAYKGMLVATHLEEFYPDLAHPQVESAFALFHQRFSTNTLPEWRLAQPGRALAHNGEINTIQGNRNWMTALAGELWHERFEGMDRGLVAPLVAVQESDSASLDHVVELLMLAGFSPEHAINLAIPPVWETVPLPREVKDFFEYQSLLMKPWDGPAAVVFTDGRTVGAHMDRNGLRPLRYTLTEDGFLVLGSEAGMVEVESAIKEKGRLGPGDTLSVDLAAGRVRKTEEILRSLAARRPYGQWLESSLVRAAKPSHASGEKEPGLGRKQAAMGYSREEVDIVIREMAANAKEFVFSMGDDTPLAPLSEKPQLLFRYFKQRFAQVTNPPIDSVRERLVMSLRMNLGRKGNFLAEEPGHARRLAISSPILTQNVLDGMEAQDRVPAQRVSICYPRGQGLGAALGRVGQEVLEAVSRGVEILVLSDRELGAERVAVPSLLALAASMRSLAGAGLLARASIVLESAEVRDVPHLACLVGYGASAVHPWLAYRSIEDLSERGHVPLAPETACAHYRQAMEAGLLKVMARMGISTINSYHGAQLFDAVGLAGDFLDEFFPGTPGAVQVDGLKEVEASVLTRHARAFDGPEPALENAGTMRFRPGGERHAWSPRAVRALIAFVRGGSYEAYREFARLSEGPPIFLRHLMRFRGGAPVPVDEVEGEGDIIKRFVTGAMSVGSLSPETHETIARACNRLGIRSNSGEGGEDPRRYGTEAGSAIKQVASGRFGVTPAYLASARELEIKMSQGAKPGEGGHLPLDKVTPYIASLRHCAPHMLLISPPPHHDIYSIEDLAQLVHDLKQANPEALVCVKLVAEAGVGTVAAGVAKAYADIVQISGCEGGTGAAALSSIKNAGSYWELGLAETQRVLVENGLRERITMRVDGGMRSGRDVVRAALLGAEEYGFGTAAMIAAGCVMARKCHLNTCPTGIATQEERLRARYTGTVEGVMAYFRALARDVRETLAGLGLRSMDEAIGRADLLAVLPTGAKTAAAAPGMAFPVRSARRRNDNPAPSRNDELVKELLPFIERGEHVERTYRIRNTDRSIPATLNYHIARLHGDRGLPEGTINLVFHGTAGQSFGAFNHRGLALTLVGEANDYVAKGMYGGRVVLRPPEELGEPHRHVIAGNTLLYGAVGGTFHASGTVGERFAVRLSGARAVVEGAGEHLCEYMTRGTVAVLGEAGHNIGSGMTGGVLFVRDEDGSVGDKINAAYVKAVALEDDESIALLRELLEAHRALTGSPLAAGLLADFPRAAGGFRKVLPL
ncbi:MAG: glutamate synthase large subunit [Nitrospirota bacterium]